MKIFSTDKRVYHKIYGLGTVVDSALFNRSIIKFDKYNIEHGDCFAVDRDDLTEIIFDVVKSTVEYTCPECNRVAKFTDTPKACIEWLDVMNGTLCPYCIQNKR